MFEVIHVKHYAVLPLILMAALGGCTFTQDSEPFGLIWQSTVSPLNSSQTSTTALPVRASVVCKYQALGLIAWGDASVGRAKVEGKIRSIASVDRIKEGSPILATGRTCTVVRGQ